MSYLSSSTSNCASSIYVFVTQLTFADSFSHLLIRFVFLRKTKDLTEHSYHKETVLFSTLRELQSSPCSQDLSRCGFLQYYNNATQACVKKHTEFSRKISAAAKHITTASSAQSVGIEYLCKPKTNHLPLHFETCCGSQSLRKVRAIPNLPAALQPPNVRTERW